MLALPQKAVIQSSAVEDVKLLEFVFSIDFDQNLISLGSHIESGNGSFQFDQGGPERLV